MSEDRSEAEDYDFNKHFHEGRGIEAKNPRFASATLRLADKFYAALDGPVIWFREKFVLPYQKKYPWYHMQLPRVPTIDECGLEDHMCIYEANEQFRRDRAVDATILGILRYRMDDCVREEYPDWQKCIPLREDYEVAAANWYTKYGELGAQYHVIGAFMKQKHRLLWERRHGKIGCGMRNKDNEVSAEMDDH